MSKVISFYIRDLAKQQDVLQINGTNPLYLSDLPATYTIVAKCDTKPVSVRLSLDAQPSHLEIGDPYCLLGSKPIVLTEGEHTIKAATYIDASGIMGESIPLELKFIVKKEKTGSISGLVFGDANADGKFSGSIDSIGVGKTVKLVSGGSVVAKAVTGADGKYRFENLPSGNYEIARDFPSGYIISNPTNPNGSSILVTLTAGQDANVDIGSKSISTPTPTPVPTPTPTPVPTPSTNMPLKGFDALAGIPKDKRDALAKELGAQGTREWYNHSDRFTVLPKASEFAGLQRAADWILGLDPNNVFVITIAREAEVDSKGNLTRTQSRPPKDADIRAWAKAYWEIWKKYGKRVIHQIVNEFDHIATKSPKSGHVYFQADPKPAGSSLSDMEWTIKSFIETIQKPFYETLKQLGGDDAVVAGGSITWNIVNFELACSKYDYTKYCDIGDMHRYALGVNDWVSVYKRAKAAMGGKPLMCSEWGAAHYNASSTTTFQANLIKDGYEKFAPYLDYTFYYIATTNDKSASINPGLYYNGVKAQPLFDALAKLPGKKF